MTTTTTSECSVCSKKMTQVGDDWTMDDGTPMLSVAAPAGFSDSVAYQTNSLAKDPSHYNSAVYYHEEFGMYPWQHIHTPGTKRTT